MNKSKLTNVYLTLTVLQGTAKGYRTQAMQATVNVLSQNQKMNV